MGCATIINRAKILRFVAAVAAFAISVAAEQTPDPLQSARIAEQAGRLAEAEKHYERALTIKPSPEIWQRLGLVRHLQSHFTAAIPALLKAVELDPSLWASHLFLGIAFYRTNDFSRALDSLAKAERLQPEHPEIRFWLGATNLALRRYPEGLRLLELRLASDPKNPEVLQLLASAYREYSLLLWNSVAENHFYTASGQMVHGRALEAQGAFDDAMAAYVKAGSLQPQRPGVQLAIAKLAVRQGKPAAAIAALEREIRINSPDSVEAQRLLKELRQ